MTSKKAASTLADFHPLPSGRNPNKHTQQGMGQLDAAMSRQGYVAPMTAAADGAILDGNARLETVATKFPGVDPLVVEHDGTRPVVMVRTDIADANAPLALDIIVSANRVAEADLAYDLDVLRDFAAEGLDLAPYEFGVATMGEIVAGVDAPELASGDKGDYEQMTFTLHRDQAISVRDAVDKAKDAGHAHSALNENSNGNALAAVCEAYRG
jgi:ParB family transcriptional regulator, chromosome partitioning protein